MPTTTGGRPTGSSTKGHAGNARTGAIRAGRGRAGTGRTGAAGSRGPEVRAGSRQKLRRRQVRRPKRRRPALRIPLADGHRRLHAVLIAMAIAISLCAGRLLQLQGFDSSAYAATSSDLLTVRLPLLPARGEITDRNGIVLASTQPAVAVTADPTLTAPKAAEIATVLSGHLGMPVEELMPLLTKANTHFVYLKKKVPAQIYTQIAADLAQRDIYGVFREQDPIRNYPTGSAAAGVVGFLGPEGKGAAGLELSMNRELSGVEGKEIYTSAPNGSKIPLGPSTIVDAQNGANVSLTIDSDLQWVAERRLTAQVRKMSADWGFAITINVKTGEVLAMANAPTLDSSTPAKAKPEDRGNRAISSPYEPGSVEKILTAAALTDSGTATPDTRVVVPPLLRSGPFRIKDAFGHGTVNFRMRGIIAHSSNIGTALLARQMDKQVLRDHLLRFGLGSKTGIELPGESGGILAGSDFSDEQRDQMAFGQALAVTGIQEASAIAGIVNNGVYNPPTIIRSVTDANGQPVAVDRRPPRQIVSPESSAMVRDLMGAVIDSVNGQKNLKLDGYQTGGKTGTAQRADPKCHCYKGYVTSFVGIAPLDDPQLLTYVVLSNPKNGDTGSSTAAPVYRDIMHFALPRYSVTPNAKEHKPLPTKW